jgi:hypothetical protein
MRGAKTKCIIKKNMGFFTKYKKEILKFQFFGKKIKA